MARLKVHDEALRARLLERAGAMLSAGGLAAVSLRTLARDCGTSTTAVYSLFGGKPALLTAVLNEAFRKFAADLGAVEPGEDAVADLVRLGTAYRLGALSDPHVFDAMFGGDLDSDGQDSAAAAFRPLRELVERAVQDKALRSDLDPATAAVTLWSTVHGWITLQRRGLLPDGGGPRLEDALRAILDGWRAPEPL